MQAKGQKNLIDWLNSKYCRTKEITKENVAAIVKEYLSRQ
jgi:hypothetical protein